MGLLTKLRGLKERKRLKEQGGEQKRLNKIIIEDVSELLTKVESTLSELENCRNESELFYRGNKIDDYLRMVSAKLTIFLGCGGKLERELYDRTITLSRKSSETLKNYTSLNLFLQSVKDRTSYLTETVNRYQPELIQNIA